MRQSAAARPELPTEPTHRIDSQITVLLIPPAVQNVRHLHGKVVPAAAAADAPPPPLFVASPHDFDQFLNME
jgi:hypothetical protein